MKRIRALYRVVVLVANTLRLMGGLALSRLADRVRHALGRPIDEAASRARVDATVGSWARQTANLIGMRVHVEGDLLDVAAAGPVAIVSNHLGYMDIVALWCVVPGAFVAKADVAGWPLIGRCGRLVGNLFVDRTRKRDLLRVIPEMEATLRSGRNVLFFPEGTSSPGARILPFKSPLFEAAVRAGAPVVAASLQYETASDAPPADWSVGWWGDMTFGPHVFALLHLDGFDARVRFSGRLDVEAPKRSARRVALPDYGNRIDLPIANHAGCALPRLAQTASCPGKERKELCRLAYEATLKKFIPTRAAGPPSRPAYETPDEAPDETRRATRK